MGHYVFSAVVLVLILASAALGSHVRARLADHHFSEDSLAAMRIAVGLVATLSALVLSLLISSGKSSLDLVNSDRSANGGIAASKVPSSFYSPNLNSRFEW